LGEDRKTKKKKMIIDLIKDFGSVGQMMSKFFIDKFSSFIELRKFSKITIYTFSKFHKMLLNIKEFFTEKYP